MSEALFFDAHTHHDQEVKLEMRDQALCVLSLSGESLAEWPYENLQVIKRGTGFGKNLATFVVGHQGNNISRLKIFRPEVRAELAKRSDSFRRQLGKGLLTRFSVWMGWM